MTFFGALNNWNFFLQPSFVSGCPLVRLFFRWLPSTCHHRQQLKPIVWRCCMKDRMKMKLLWVSRTATPTLPWWCTSRKWYRPPTKDVFTLSVVSSPEELPLVWSAASWVPTTSLARKTICARSLSNVPFWWWGVPLRPSRMFLAVSN